MMGHNEGPPLDGEGQEPGIEQQIEDNEFNALIGMTVEEILREGQKALFARLVGRCRLGTANHQELAILRNILKDNGLTLGLPPVGSSPTKGNTPVPADLPSFTDPDYDQ